MVVGGVCGEAGLWGFMFVLFFFFSLVFVSLYEEGVYLRGDEKHRKLYLVKAGFYRILFCES